MRTPKDTDFALDVEGFGRFIFARRTKEDVFKIRARYAALTENHYTADGRVADFGALAIVTLQTLMVSAPDTFDLDAIDPLLDDDFDKDPLKVFEALRERELSFRPKPAKASEAAGTGTSK